MGDLANKVRTKYPGAYDDMNDQQLEAAVVAKYPEYKDMVGPSVPTLTNQAPQSFGDKLMRGAKAFGSEFAGGGGGYFGTVGNYAKAMIAPGIAAGEAAQQGVQNARAEGGDAYAYGSNFAKGLPVAGAVVRAGESQAQGQTPEAIGQGLAGLAQYAGVRNIEPVAQSIEGVGKSIPSLERARGNFQDVMSKAKGKTVPITDELSGALSRYQELVDRGGSRSVAVNKLLNRITNPDSSPMTYAEARDFASNVSRLSADEYARLTPQMKQQIGAIRVALNNAVGQAAESAGKGAQYQSAMSEYARAAKMKGVVKDVSEAAVSKLPYIGAGYAVKKIYDAF